MIVVHYGKLHECRWKVPLCRLNARHKAEPSISILKEPRGMHCMPFTFSFFLGSLGECCCDHFMDEETEAQGTYTNRAQVAVQYQS